MDYHTRRKYNRLLENETNWMNNKEYDDDCKLYELFDKCLLEMTNLVRAAFSRYKQSDTFLVMQSKSKSVPSVDQFDDNDENQGLSENPTTQ